MRVAVTGAAGRLGSALIHTMNGTSGLGVVEVVGWTRAEFDLDNPEPVALRLAADRPDMVIHAAAWTDVDGCARDPQLALRRNGVATDLLARACARNAVSLIVVSTNEVFDGERTDSVGYRPGDAVNPGNAYGRSKLVAERAASDAFRDAQGATLGIVRTAWLFGPGKPDFPAKVLAAARMAIEDSRPLRLVSDEIGSPTYVPDLARAIVALAAHGPEGTHHVVNADIASRADWARDVLGRLGKEVAIEEIGLRDLDRPSRPPRWGVLEASPIPGGPLRSWREAMTERIAAMASPQ